MVGQKVFCPRKPDWWLGNFSGSQRLIFQGRSMTCMKELDLISRGFFHKIERWGQKEAQGPEKMTDLSFSQIWQVEEAPGREIGPETVLLWITTERAQSTISDGQKEMEVLACSTNNTVLYHHWVDASFSLSLWRTLLLESPPTEWFNLKFTFCIAPKGSRVMTSHFGTPPGR